MLQVVTVDSTKYSYLVATLPEDVATRALDYIESMADSDSTEKYKGLKDELLGNKQLFKELCPERNC